MREIKFRIWDKDHNMWLDLCDLMGDYQQNAFRTYGDPFHLCDFFEDTHDEDSKTRYKEGSIIVQQYTGIKDKDGKEIYEGDIVRFNEPVELSDGLFLSTLYVFEFYNGSFLRPYIYQSLNGSKFINLGENKLKPTGRAKLEDNPHFDLTKAEIVGNIFETPFEIDL
jgi:uncharacterized phage protein (TIGR01671 family)